MKRIKAPVLFLVFNRPEKTLRVWEQIEKAKPAKLYVSADGPRITHPGDAEKCRQVRSIVLNVTWECETNYLFHDENLGCSLAGKTAFEWVFTREDRMIELEDDTVPSLSFFTFMDELLEKYKDCQEVGYVTGQNFMGIRSGEASYFFSHYDGSSGWGTWKRVFNQWDYRLEHIEKAYSRSFRRNFDSLFEYRYWLRKFEYYARNGGKTYDLQSMFLIFEKDFKNIIPNRNLITNIGFDAEGTNFNGGEEKFADKERFEIGEIVHPQEIKRNVDTDRKIFEYHFLGRTRMSYLIRWTLGPCLRKFVAKRK